MSRRLTYEPGGGVSRSSGLEQVDGLQERLARDDGRVIDDFSSVGSWTASTGILTGGDTSQAGRVCAKVVTDGVGGAFTMRRDVFFDGRGKFISFDVLPDGATAQLDFGVMVNGSDYNTSSFARSNVMKNGSQSSDRTFRPGVWTTVTVPMAMLGANGSSAPSETHLRDVRGVQIGVRDAGSGASTVYLSDFRVHEYQFDPGVVWVFDDARLDTYTKAFPILREAGHVGVVAVPTALVGTTSSYQHASWAQLLEMQAAGWELVSHSRNHTTLQGQSAANVETQIRGARADLIANGANPAGASFFVWPGGLYDATSLAVVERHCRASRSLITGVSAAGNGPNYLTPPFDDLHRLPTVYPQFGVTSVATLKAYADRVSLRGGVAMYSFHSVADTNPGSDVYTYLTADFRAVVQHVVSLGLRSYRMSDLYGVV